MAQRQQRNYGIDLLRMVAMFMVAVLHVLYQGGVLGRVYAGTSQHTVAWFLEIAAYGAVDLYALISGYVGVNSKYRLTNLAVLWLQVFFYSFGIALFFSVFLPNLYNGAGLLEYAFPVVTGKYWYFSAYVCLFLFMPLLNAGINALSKQILRRVIVGMILVFSVVASVAKEIKYDTFILVSGYSGLWLMILYAVGGYIRKYGMWEKVKQPALFGIWLVCTVLSFASHRFIPVITRAVNDGAAYYAKFPTSYISPLILLGSIALLLFFSRMKLGNAAKRVVSFFAPAAFGVYIIHVHPLVWEHFMKDRFAFIATMHPLVMWLVILLCAFAVYLVCSLIDLLRIQLFKLLRIKKGCQALENKLFKEDEKQKQKIGNRS